MTSSLVSLQAVTKRLGAAQVLRGMTFDVRRGEILGLLGPNGSGKTTTIRCISGVIRPDAGEIAVDGLHPYVSGDEVRRRIGVLTETAAFYHDLTALDNLRFYGKVYGIRDDRRALQLLEEFGLSEMRDRKAGTFSTGQKKRLGLAKALLHDPDILFLDEPTNGLDPEGIRQVMAEIVRLNEAGKTVMVCSHVLQQLESICHRYVFMEGGRVLEQGTQAELELKYRAEVHLVVETDLDASAGTFAGLPMRQVAAGQVEFTLSGRDEVPGLLRRLTAEANVWSANVANQDLQALYFKVREGARHE